MRLILDRLLGVVLLLLAAPLLALFAALIKLESPGGGPAFRRYARTDDRGLHHKALSFRVFAGEPGSNLVLTRTGHFLYWSGLEDLPLVVSLASGAARLAWVHEGSAIRVKIRAAKPSNTSQDANVIATSTKSRDWPDKRS